MFSLTEINLSTKVLPEMVISYTLFMNRTLEPGIDDRMSPIWRGAPQKSDNRIRKEFCPEVAKMADCVFRPVACTPLLHCTPQTAMPGRCPLYDYQTNAIQKAATVKIYSGSMQVTAGSPARPAGHGSTTWVF